MTKKDRLSLAKRGLRAKQAEAATILKQLRGKTDSRWPINYKSKAEVREALQFIVESIEQKDAMVVRP